MSAWGELELRDAASEVVNRGRGYNSECPCRSFSCPAKAYGKRHRVSNLILHSARLFWSSFNQIKNEINKIIKLWSSFYSINQNMGCQKSRDIIKCLKKKNFQSQMCHDFSQSAHQTPGLIDCFQVHLCFFVFNPASLIYQTSVRLSSSSCERQRSTWVMINITMMKVWFLF